MKRVLFCLRRVGLPLFLLTAIVNILDQWITNQMQSELISPQGTSPVVWLWGGGSLILNLIGPLLALLIVLSALSESKKSSWWQFLRTYFNQNLIEALRVWGKTLSWSFIFIFPGLIRFFQYLLVPFVVCFDPEYQADRRDALQTSRLLSRGRLLSLVGSFFLFSVLVPLGLTAFDSNLPFWRRPLTMALLCFVEMLTNLCFIVALSQIYKSQTQMEMGDESDVSMAGN